MRKIVSAAVTTLLALTVTTLTGCQESAVNHEIYRAMPGDDASSLISQGCIARTAGGGAGGGSSAILMVQENAPDGGMKIDYLLPPVEGGPEDVYETDDPDLILAGTITLSEEDIASGEDFAIEFDGPDGSHFEVVHWGSDSC